MNTKYENISRMRFAIIDIEMTDCFSTFMNNKSQANLLF